jgi:outer membrane protein assembly factor BamB
MHRTLLIALVFGNAVLRASAGDWPAWRGPNGDGISSEKALPTEWTRQTNVRWRVPLPDRGNSTPIVFASRVFVTQAVEKQGWRGLICFDRKDGKLLWKTGVTYTESEPTHATNPYCSASPVTDGERLIASYGSAGVYCYDMDGNEIWHRDFGPQLHIWGNAASPVIYHDLCIQNVGPGERTFLVALDKKTGTTVWRHDELGGEFGTTNKEWIGSWTTPVIIHVNGHDELIMSFPNRVAALDPKTGKELWTCSGLGPLVYTSPIWSGQKGDDPGTIVAMSGYGGPFLAVRPGGSGDVTETHRIWHIDRAKQRIGSGVIVGDYIYIHNDPGITECIELATGKLVWQERLKSSGDNGTSWSSMVRVSDRLYVVNHAGDSFVLRASPTFELLSTNSLDERTLASHAVSNGDIFIRTYQSLWCIGSPSTEASGGAASD